MKTWKEKSEELSALDGAVGKRVDELVWLSEGIDSNPIGLATITLRGPESGPRIWLEAQTHGDEPNATEAILRLVREIRPDEMRGILVVAPAMHAAAVRHFMRESPLDGKNGNRIWGIDWTNLGHTRVFSYIWMKRVSELIEALNPDLVIDMHDGGIPLRIMSHALYDEAALGLGPVDGLCRISGMKVVWASKGGRFAGNIGSHMNTLGFPSIMLEAGGTGRLVEEDIQEMLVGLRNVLREVKMIPGDPTPRQDEQLFMDAGNWVRAERAGLFYSDVRLGDSIQKGAPIGQVSDMFGHITEEIRSPADGIVFGLRHAAVANVGDYVANIGHVS